MRKLALLLALAALPSGAQVPLPPAPAHYVTDPAGLLDDAREQALNERLAQYDRDTSNQVIVYVDRAVPAGTTLEELAAAAIRTWAVGQKKNDNGAILFLFVDDRASRIEVGYGLEGTLTDALSKRILVGLRPALRGGDYTAAVEQGAEAIIRTIGAPGAGNPNPIADTRNADFPYGLVLILIFAVIAVALVCFRHVLARLFGTDQDTSAPYDPDFGNPEITVSPTPERPAPHSSSSSWSSSSSSGSSSSSSSSSSSGFTGGGGSGGGGGASDKW